MKRLWFWLWSGCVLAVLPAPQLRAGVVELRNGRSIEGIVRIDEGKVIVRTRAGQDEKFEIDQVQRVNTVESGTSDATVPGKARPGEGLRAEYYSDTNLSRLVLTRIDASPTFDLPENVAPDPLVKSDFSVRWTGTIEAKHSETYTFEAQADDGIRVWIDGERIIQKWSSGSTSLSGQAALEAGRKHEIKIEFNDTGGAAILRLYWQSPSQPREIIPPSAFKPPQGMIGPEVRLASPKPRAALPATSPVVIEIEATDADGQVRQVEVFAGEQSVGIVKQAPWRLEWKDVESGEHELVARAVDNDGLMAVSDPVTIKVNGGGSLPLPWADGIVGRLKATGSAKLQGDAFTLESAESEMWGDRDGIYFVFQPLTGDGSIVARLVSFAPGQAAGSAAGVMVLESRSRDKAKQAIMGVAPDTGITFFRREHEWEERKLASTPGQAPLWLKLSRHGRLLKGYYSTDGQKWESMGSRRIEMRPNIYFGLTLINPGEKQGNAVFDHVSVVPGAPVPKSTLKGVLLRSGSLIACNLHHLDETSLRIGRDREYTLPRNHLAQVLLKPMTEEMIESLEPGRSGVLLSDGDFFDGKIDRFRDGHLHVNSVLFGVRRYNVWDNVVAAVFAEPSPVHSKFIVRLRDGSEIRAKALTAERNQLRAVEECDVTFFINGNDVVEILAR